MAEMQPTPTPATTTPALAGKRSYLALAPLAVLVLTRVLSRWMTAEQAKTLASVLGPDMLEWVAGLTVIAVAWFKSRAATATTPAKPALPQIGKSALLSVLAAPFLLAGCCGPQPMVTAAHWQPLTNGTWALDLHNRMCVTVQDPTKVVDPKCNLKMFGFTDKDKTP